jgi:hypothetical protein
VVFWAFCSAVFSVLFGVILVLDLICGVESVGDGLMWERLLEV